MRAYIIPTFTWTARNLQSFPGILVNRKRLMPPEAMAKWEGKTMYIGGAVEDGETFLEAALREAQEEVGWNIHADELVFLTESQNFIFYGYKIQEPVQAFYNKLAGACTEGTIDIVLKSSIGKEDWPSWDFSHAAYLACHLME